MCNVLSQTGICAYAAATELAHMYIFVYLTTDHMLDS